MHRFHQVHPPEPEIGKAEPAAAAPMARYPLSISADRRRLLDADGRPFLIQGDAAWSLIANLDSAEVVRYLDDRRSKGFNTLIVNLIEHLYSQDPPRDRAGREPFARRGDMTAPNDAYFDWAEQVLDACAERGFAVILAPAYIGYRRDRGAGVSLHLDGWYDEIVATGPEGCRSYGAYLGRRFGRFANIIWCIGGDWHPEEARAVVGAGHELAIHSWIHEFNSKLSHAVERDLALRATDMLAKVAGKRPVGMRTASWDFSVNTLDIVRELGLLYDSSLMADDDPYELMDAGEPTGIVELPPEWIRDDAVYYNFVRFSALRPYTPPSAVEEIFTAEFDGAWEEGGLFLLTMHPHLTGHRSRLAMLEKLVKYMKSKPSVWFATHEQIANHVKGYLKN